MTRRRGLSAVLASLLGAGAAFAQPLVDVRSAPPQRFQLFPAPPSADAVAPLAGIHETRLENLVRLPGDPDSLFTLGGPAPSGRPAVRLAVEVNEVLPKALTPDPKVDANDGRGRAGGDWKPLDAMGRPYQLRFGARLIW